MKTIQNLLVIIIMLSSLRLSYLIGRRSGLETRDKIEIDAAVMAEKIRFKNEVSDRYFKVFGIPEDQESQCKFDYIISKDSSECK